MVTTTGARSGRPRTSPLLAIGDRAQMGSFALIASNWGQHQFPSWYFNLKRDPRAVCNMNGQAATYLAHEATGEEYQRFWTYAVETYYGYTLYRQRAGRRIPIMVMEKE
jgi:deazaflavin-dependent oxidoreductase (nitroreductase family)